MRRWQSWLCPVGTSTLGRKGGTRRVSAGRSWVLSEIGATFSLIFLEAKEVKRLPSGWKSSKPAQKGRGGVVVVEIQSKRKNTR